MTESFFEDQNLTCRDCKQPYVFTGGEQRFFSEKGFTPPTRCKACRQARKAQKDVEGGAQGYAPAPAQSASADVYRRVIVQDVPPPDAGGRPQKKIRGGGGKRRDWDGGSSND